MRFWKWDALGNVYVIVEQPDAGTLDEARVLRLCDPAKGVGSDGVIEVRSATETRAEVVIWNPDGSTAEMSGNGVRIAACWLARRTGASHVTIETGGRAMPVRLLAAGCAAAEMGEVAVGAEEIVDVGEPVSLTTASVGNPHAVVRLDGAGRDDLLRLGPLLEAHERFPQRTNVQLVEPASPHDLRVLVWERGVGETSASGSSSVAAAAVAVARGWCESPVTVHLPGGELEVSFDGRNATLTGPAAELDRGETDI